MAPGDTRRASARLTVVVTDGRGRPAGARGLARWLTRVAPSRAQGALTVALVSDTQARVLNRRYRRRDYATDVLSFPSESRAGRGTLRPARFLGDIVIAKGVARRQARAASHGEQTELRILALHGLLHLLGYDHHHDRGTMAGVERRLRKKGGLRHGLIERSRQ
jgi:probable rRNA maturation factor